MCRSPAPHARASTAPARYDGVSERSAASPGARPRRAIALALAAVLLVGAAFAIGRFTAFDASTVPPTPSTTSAEAGFARDMQAHHAQAVDMAMTTYRRTDDESLRLLAYDIATSQQSQIGTMSEWLIAWGLPALGDPRMTWMHDGDGHGAHAGATATQSVEELHAAMGMATSAQLTELDRATGTDADCLFLSLMIRHHEGAVTMVDAVLKRGKEPRVLALAGQMAAAQTAEIATMRALQADIGCS